ncbi:hypothetical protein NESM_000708600 [Novymonas esmeraldas]|uniref:Uncharacterized protein n=1 Tax=Novymonas esmeraldas TaxID=1808958 RepID=A0AAW0EVX9_9TRYP
MSSHAPRAGAASSTAATPPAASSSSSSSSADGAAAAAASARGAVGRVYTTSRTTRDPFLRDGTALRRFLRAYRTRLPFAARMFGIFAVGFAVGLVLEVFACKTHLYESVMMKKDSRRHEFDEFVVDLRQNVARWQREDVQRRQTPTSSS